MLTAEFDGVAKLLCRSSPEHGRARVGPTGRAYPSLRAVKGPDLPAWKPARSGLSGRAAEPERYQ